MNVSEPDSRIAVVHHDFSWDIPLDASLFELAFVTGQFAATFAVKQ